MHHSDIFRYIQIIQRVWVCFTYRTYRNYCITLLHLGRNDLLSRPLQPVGLRANLTRCGDALHIPAPSAPCHTLPQRTAPRPWMSWEKSLQRTSARLRQGLGKTQGYLTLSDFISSIISIYYVYLHAVPTHFPCVPMCFLISCSTWPILPGNGPSKVCPGIGVAGLWWWWIADVSVRQSMAKHGKAGATCYGPLWGGVSNADKPNPVMETAQSVWIYFPVLGIVCLPAEKALAFHLFSPHVWI